MERLRKILELERAKGCTDTAVIGGLDAFLRRWRQDNESSTVDTELVSLLPTRYASLSAAQRRRLLDQVLERLGRGGGRSPGDSTQPSPAGTQPAATGATLSLPKGSAPRAASAGRHGTPSLPRTAAAEPQTSPPATTLEAPVTVIRGVKAALAAKFERLGVVTVRDLLYFFPRRYLDYSQIKPISQLEAGLEQTVEGTVWEARETVMGRGRRGTEATIGDETGNIRVVWFNQPYLARRFPTNARVVISGRVGLYKGRLVFESPEYELVESGELVHAGRLVPVYPLTEGLYARTVRRVVKEAVDRYAPLVPDPLPTEIRGHARLMELSQAIRQAHFPDSQALGDGARRRLAFDELFLIQIGVLSRRQAWREGQSAPILQPPPGMVEGFVDSLPFRLTTAQRRVLDEIRGDLARPRPMSRLLQGEVGSGKTVVATAAMLMAVLCGYQAALMAPTEILAEQHFASICRLLGAAPGDGAIAQVASLSLSRPLTLGLLAGSVKKGEKESLHVLIAEGKVDMAIGTHALIQKEVEFPRLAVAVVDEQHRFGVMQRFTLRQKGTGLSPNGSSPHVLVMSATPIPRTLALTLYGDLDLSVIDELPPGRQEIKTKWLGPRQRESAYRFVREQVAQGRQAFIICPLIEESAAIEAKAAVVEYERLSRTVFPDLRLGLLHGRMGSAEKDEVMRCFRAGELDILVSTPVVEVGIDVPNATVMLIEAAERFGLAQLHQFRGRVGRGVHRSYCLLLSEGASPEARERLGIMERTRDGFVLAEEDLRLRGPGEFFGTRQSGLPDLRLARLSDVPLLELAREEAIGLFKADPKLERPEHQLLAAEVRRLWKRGTGEMS